VYVRLQEARAELVAAFKSHPWLNMLHLHVGSQGLELATTIAGIQAVWSLLQEIEAACGKGRVRVLDIGGGLSVDFATDDAPEVRACCCYVMLLFYVSCDDSGLKTATCCR
jgi:diaminopimelate decarboxylase